MRAALVVIALVGCGKSDKPAAGGSGAKDDKPAGIAIRKDDKAPPPPAPDAAPAADAACVAGTKELEPWLAAVRLEQSSQEIDFGSKLQPIDRPPSPVSHEVDNAIVTKSIAAYDTDEHNHVGGTVEPAGLDAKLAAMHAKTSTERDAGPPDTIRIDVDVGATWGDVARLVTSATKAGYKDAIFAFTATHTSAPPDGVEAVVTDESVTKAAGDAIKAMKAKCSAWDNLWWMPDAKKSPEANAADFGAKTAAALLACNCAAPLKDVRAALWRDSHWHQARPRVGLAFKLGGTATKIAQPAATPWSDAHKKLLDLAPGSAIEFAAN